MVMPEATVYEHNNFARWEHKIRAPRQARTTQSVSKALRVQSLADKQFRLGVLAAYAGHHPASRGFAYNVCHACVSSGWILMTLWK